MKNGTVAIILKGDKQQLAKVEKGSEEAIQQLFEKAGLSGTFEAHLERWKRGTSHTKGLLIASPGRFGVRLTWQPSGNGRRVVLSIQPPNGMEVHALHSRLKHAISLAESDEKPLPYVSPEEEGVSTPPLESTVLAAILSGSSKPRDTTDTSGLAESSGTTSDVRQVRFTNDQENIDLFLLELEGLADIDRFVSKSTCHQVLSDSFGIRTRGLYHVLDALVRRGILVKSEKGEGFYLPRKKNAESPPPATSPEQSPPDPINPLLEAYHKLEIVVLKTLVYTDEVQRLDGELAELRVKTATLTADRARAKKALDDCKAAEKRLAQIRQLLGLS